MSNENRLLIFKDTNLVTKANSFIELTYKLGVMEQKIILSIASNIKPTDKDFQTYTFTIKEFGELLGTKAKSIYSDIDKITQKLMDKSFLIFNTEGKPTRISWLSKATYNTSEGTITVRFDPDLKPFFLALNEKFTRYKLGNIIHLRSSYSIRMFELLKSYEGLTERTFSLEDLRSKLGMGDKYPKWINFRQRVLDHAQQELEEKTDISFTYTTIKKGRSIDKVKFKIKPNKSKQITNVDEKVEKIIENQDFQDVQKLALQLGFTVSKKIVNEWLKFGKESVIEVMKSTRYNSKINSHIPYISKLLREKAKEKADTFNLDPKEVLIAKFIRKESPNKKGQRFGTVVDFIMEGNAIEFFMENGLTREEAYVLWEKNGDYMCDSIQKNRNAIY